MIDIVNSAVQAVAENGGVVFGAPRIRTGCTVRHENGTARFVLLRPGIYHVLFTGNISIPATETAQEIRVGLSIDGELVNGTEAVYRPSAVDRYGNVTVAALVRVYGCGNCDSNVGVAIVNTSDIEINVRDANLIIDRRCGGEAG